MIYCSHCLAYDTLCDVYSIYYSTLSIANVYSTLWIVPYVKYVYIVYRATNKLWSDQTSLFILYFTF